MEVIQIFNSRIKPEGLDFISICYIILSIIANSSQLQFLEFYVILRRFSRCYGDHGCWCDQKHHVIVLNTRTPTASILKVDT